MVKNTRQAIEIILATLNQDELYKMFDREIEQDSCAIIRENTKKLWKDYKSELERDMESADFISGIYSLRREYTEPIGLGYRVKEGF